MAADLPRIVTAPVIATEDLSCDGSYTCECPKCRGALSRCVERGVRYYRPADPLADKAPTDPPSGLSEVDRLLWLAATDMINRMRQHELTRAEQRQFRKAERLRDLIGRRAE